MYIPNSFKVDDQESIEQMIHDYGFATLISTDHKNQPLATHLPLLLFKEKGRTFLKGHLAKANEQAKALTEGRQVLAIFQGPHTYVSSSWYKRQDAPTWNYVAVHVYGKIHLVDNSKTLQSLRELVDKYESGTDHPVKVDKLPEGMVDRYMSDLVGFEIEIDDIQAAFKLSQNHPAEDIHTIVDKLEQSGDTQAKAVAELMKKHNS